MRLHTKNKLPRLPGSAFKVPDLVAVVLPIIKSLPTHVEVELGCDNINNLPMCSLIYVYFGNVLQCVCLSPSRLSRGPLGIS